MKWRPFGRRARIIRGDVAVWMLLDRQHDHSQNSYVVIGIHRVSRLVVMVAASLALSCSQHGTETSGPPDTVSRVDAGRSVSALLDAGRTHTCIVARKGVRCWGNNDEGQTNVPALRHPRQV